MTTRHDKERQRAAQEKYQAVLSQLLKDEDNKYCVDCDAKGPRWASWNLGIFLCIRCAGIHRNLGVHISKVKSVNLDTWTAEQLAMLMEMGNSRARAVYEANLPDNFRRPQTDSALEAFIRAKYEHKRYIAREWVQPNPSVPRQVKKELLEDEHKDKKKSRGRPSSMIQLNAPSQKHETKEETNQPLKEVAKETKKTSHADDLLNLSSPGESGNAKNVNLLDDFLGASGTPTAVNATPPPAQNQNNGQTCTSTSSSNQQTFQQNGAFDDSLFTNVGSEIKGNTSDKTTKESIMALYGSSNQQQGMYGVPGGMYMPAQALNMQGVPSGNPMAVQQGMPGMVPQGMMVMQQANMYQMAAGGMMPATAVGNPLAPGPGMLMQQPPQVGMFPAASPPQPQMSMQQMQQQMAAMRLNQPGTMAPGGQMAVRPQAGVPGAAAANPWGMQATAGQTLSTNLWQ